MDIKKIANSDIRELAIYFGDLSKDAPAWNAEVSEIYRNEVALRLKYNQLTLEKERVRDEKNEELRNYEEKEFDIEFECQFLTPFIGEKIDSKEMYFALIYWWRSINGHLPVSYLEQKEKTIWGSINYSKKVVMSDIKIDIITNAISKNGIISVSSKFKVGVRINNSKISLEEFTKVFTLFSTLGGLGRYSQRASGAFEIIGSSINTLEKLVTVLESNKFRVFEKQIISLGQQMNKYPYIKEIKIGSPNADILNKIKLTETLFDSYDSRNTLRNGHNPNYSQIKGCYRAVDVMSPVHIGVVRTKNGFCPVITVMNSVEKVDYRIIRKFIDKIN